MGRVFVSDEPLRASRNGKRMVRRLDLSPAEEFGELVFVFDWSQLKDVRREGDARDLLWIARSELADFNPKEDYILQVGGMTGFGILLAAALENSPVVRMLEWSAPDGRYYVIELDVTSQPIENGGTNG